MMKCRIMKEKTEYVEFPNKKRNPQADSFFQGKQPSEAFQSNQSVPFILPGIFCLMQKTLSQFRILCLNDIEPVFVIHEIAKRHTRLFGIDNKPLAFFF